ncbi:MULTISPECIES: NADPH-dependent FMN reductase [Enterococcus]|uniref:Flavin reductase n=1 Tax=Enterococcus thailandicus TaxID=417368 RepID=A0A179ERH8_ENTTH|nr:MULTISPECIES: NAD(P)H-dependent oxidoreductase [Enterococcus]ASZ07052.1 NAD(P)H-dependent oxidoreductase [Enterococcus thailandicus]MDA3964513.1 NAD(P)H-dependent oxidoreductase [Enterococcus thailandicus]MDK4352364.1 NAD(P)H-dependent oxidoreductase [Enterococcus thailandicus]MDT2734730.1 NAD(P)H-dependent oxidoreductase [Enterococcus thailandicus]MDT2794348.1 NAD(P)H-dependent oxidoreductase [Enterococcus thailandicus]
MTKKIGFFIGSLREDSYNKKVAEAFASLLPEGYESVFVKIDDLPFYNEDLETPENAPEAWTRFRNEVKDLDGVIFVSPEYNRSIPAVLKNALDVGSRPYGQSVWDTKPGLVVTASPGGIGGFGANHIIRQSLVFLNVPTLQQPEAYIGNIANLVGEDGKIIDGTMKFFETIVNAYIDFLEKLTK